MEGGADGPREGRAVATGVKEVGDDTGKEDGGLKATANGLKATANNNEAATEKTVDIAPGLAFALVGCFWFVVHVVIT